MPSSIRQIGIFDSGAANSFVQQVNISFPGSTLAGSTIVVFGTISNFAGTVIQSCSDNKNGSYNTLDIQNGGTGTGLQSVGSFWLPNASILTPSDVIAIQCSAADDYRGGCALEIVGTSATPLLAHKLTITNVGSAGTDNVSSGTAACGTNPAIIIGFGYNITNDSSFPINAGSAFTNDGKMWIFTYGSGNEVAQLEHRNLSVPGTTDTKFSSTGSDYIAAFMVALQDAGVSAPDGTFYLENAAYM